MTSMKKNFIKIVISSFILVVVILSVFLLTLKKDPLTIGYIPKQYSLLNNQDSWSLTLYANQKNSFYFDKKNINNIFLKVTNEEQLYKLHINKIQTSNEKYYISGNPYYMYQLDLNLPFLVDTLEIINNAYLSLEYYDVVINVFLGNFAQMSLDDTLNMRVSFQKGIVNQMLKGNQVIETLTGMILTLTNEEARDLHLTQIECVSGSVKTSLENIKVLKHHDYQNSMNIDDIMSEGDDLSEIKANEMITIVIKFTYQSVVYVDSLAIVLTFNEGVKTIEGVQLFKTSLNEPNVVLQAYDFY